MAVVLDGREAASALRGEFRRRVERLRAQGVEPGLGTLLVGDDPASARYVRWKHADCAEVGIRSISRTLPADADFDAVAEQVRALNGDPACTGFIVQLPLPRSIDGHAIIDMIDPAKDADGMHPVNLGELVLHVGGQLTTPLPCTPRAVIELLGRYHISLEGRDVCVVGRGITIGRTIGLLLTRRSVNATVTLCHTGTRNLHEHLRRADVIIAAAGRAHLVKAHDVKPGAVLVDVGISRVRDEADGRWHTVGDIDPDAYEVAGAYTPNPGGVGPMTRAMLLGNVVDMAERTVGRA